MSQLSWECSSLRTPQKEDFSRVDVLCGELFLSYRCMSSNCGQKVVCKRLYPGCYMQECPVGAEPRLQPLSFRGDQDIACNGFSFCFFQVLKLSCTRLWRCMNGLCQQPWWSCPPQLVVPQFTGRQSAGLSSVGTCFQAEEGTKLVTVAILLPM